MRHKLFTLFLALIASTGLLFAESGTCGANGNNLTWDLTDSVLTISGTGAMKNWSSYSSVPWYTKRTSIKSVIIEGGVTSIGKYAFYSCSNLGSANIPDGITSIGNYAFYKCSILTSITIPNGVTSIGDYAFYYCSKLTTIEIPSSVTSMGGDKVFYYCTSLTSVTIGDGVTSIGNETFSNCSSLTSITIGNSVKSIGQKAFQSCSILTSIIIPDCVTTIGQYAFSQCSGLASVKIGNGVTSIGNYAFEKCTALTSITIGNSVTSIGTYVFLDCSSLTSIDIPEGVTSLGQSAFQRCTALTSVTIPNSVTSIGGFAFDNCSSLTSITIPDAVISIGESAFNNCTDLTFVLIGDGVTSIGNSAFSGCSKLTSLTIGDSVTSIGESAFNNCTGLTSVTLSNNVTSIGKSAFNGCSKLTSINLPNSVTTIGASAFANCGLTSIEIPNGVTSIENYTFNNCNRLTSVTIPSSVTKFLTGVFNNCSSLASIDIPSSVTSIGSSAFGGCKGLISVKIPNGVRSLGIKAFYECTGLTSIDISNSVNSIGMNAFEGCSSLTSITIPNSVTAIGTNAFQNCTALTSVTLSNNVTSIGSETFSGCRSLISIVIPDGVISIGYKAFYGCKSLTSIKIPDGVTIIENYLFYQCNALTSVEIPNSVTSIESTAFSGCISLTSIDIPDGITRIPSGAFEYCRSLTSITIPYNVTSIGIDAFRSCTGLTSITIPFNVTDIEASAFSGCKGFESITCEATTPPVCGSNAFYEVNNKIIVLVPHESVEDYKAADVWKKFSNIQPLSDNSTISITLPTGVPDGYYENMTLELLNIDSQLVQKRPVLNKREFKFVSQIKGSKYQASLKNSYGQVMGQTNTAKLGNANLKLTFGNLLRTKDVSLKVTIPDGTDVTDKVSVLWADSAGKAMGFASQLKAVAEGSKLKCKVTLRDELARQYVAPDTMQFTVEGEGENLLTLQLQPMQQLTLRGLVKDQQSGEPISDASVVLTQQLGDDDQSVITTTDTLGRYDLQGTNVPGELSVTAPGYLPKTVEKVAPNAEGTLPTMEMEPFNGAIVSAWLTYAEAVPQGAESNIADGYKGYSDVAYQVYNQTKGAAVQNFIIKENLLYFPSDVAIGDELIVSASSHNSNFSPVSDTCEITTSGIGYVTLPLVQKGGLNATVSSAASNSVMGVLYDANGRFVRSNSYRSSALNFAGIASGDYSLISMTSNTLLRRVLLQSTLSDMSLVEGTDYLKNAVHIEDGRITIVNVPNVPALDMEKLHFTDSTTYFIADKNIVNVGLSNIISARVSFAEKYAGRISNVEYMVDIPEEIDFVENSAILGANAGNYRIEDGHYIFPIADIEDNRLKLCLNPKQAGEFRVSGSVRFKLDGVQMVQPVGTVWVKANGFTLKTPIFLGPSVLYVSGVAPLIYRGNRVEIYDHDKLIGSAEVEKDGMWSTTINISSSGTSYLHAIKARITVPEKGVIESKVKNVMYNTSKRIAGQVVMLSQNQERIPFSFYSKKSGFYGYLLEATWYSRGYKTPYTTEFTFLAYFDDFEVSEIKDVKITVLASDGTTRTLNAKYDAAKQCYYASSNYPHYSKIPVSAYAYAEREYSPASEEEQTALTEAKEKALVKATQAAVSAAKKKGEIELLPGDDETMNIKYTVPGKEPLAFSMKEMDYNEASAYVLNNEPLIERGEAGDIVYTLVNGTDEMELILVDMDEHYALRTLVTYAEIDDLGAGSSRRRTGPNKVSLGGYLLGMGENLGSGALAMLGLMDYVKAPEQLLEMNAQIEGMQKLLDKELGRADKLMGSCSDGSSPGFSPQQENGYIDRYNDFVNKRNDLLHQMEDARDDYVVDLCRKLLWDAGTTALGAGLVKNLAVGAATKLGPKALAALEKAGSLLETGDGKLAASTLGFAKDLVKGGKVGDIPSLDQLLSIDFNRHYKEFKAQTDNMGREAWEGLRSLNKEMGENSDCEDECEGEDCEGEDEDDEEEDDDEDDDDDEPFPDPAQPHIDPSGYIYEAVPSNRVEGATAVVYYKDYILDEEDNITGELDVMWDADTYGQVNPQITGADGMYQWDVPEGWWQVRVQKEGWQNNTSAWLPVPPPQLDVNIPLVRNKQPGVKSAHAYEDAVTVRFDSYMLPDSLTTKLITVTENGVVVAGTITLTDEEAAPDGATYASQIRFVPTKAFTATQVTLFISGQVVNYAGIEMDEPYEAVLPIEREVKGLEADKIVKVEYQSAGVIRVKGTPAAAAAGKTVTVKCMSGIITSVAQSSIVLNANGEAEVTVQGDLRGTDYVTFTMEDPELAASTTVKVVAQSAFVIEAPEASIPTDTEVERATSVTLSCPTEGAKIYYTLDGSNPLTSDTRILYDGTPIFISAETTLTAVAVVEGKGESEVVIYHYTVKLGTAITDVNVSNITVTPVRVHDSFAVNGVDGTFSVSVYSMTGKRLMWLGQVTSGQKVKATALQTGVYLVVVSGEDAYFTQRIIKE